MLFENLVMIEKSGVFEDLVVVGDLFVLSFGAIL